jgi:hypothetical protein
LEREKVYVIDEIAVISFGLIVIFFLSLFYFGWYFCFSVDKAAGGKSEEEEAEGGDVYRDMG